ncbi:MAG: molybdopterin-dependent oxidoreductase [Gaiellales bacterium]|nr:molybdopterin-dependent oxidoreductase [Gaiellales bacterium]
MAFAVNQGITRGTSAGNLAPQEAISRLAAATMLIRAQSTEVVALTVTKGTVTNAYTLADLKAMTAVTGYWGAHKGNPPYATNTYKGVPLAALLEAVGGLDADEGLTVNTSDNFPCEYDAARLAQVAGGTYQVWDKMTGAESTAAVQLIVAYEMDGSPLPADSLGRLRLVPVTSTDAWAAEGKYSPHHVVALVAH